jgi:hypothetical protein
MSLALLKFYKSVELMRVSEKEGRLWYCGQSRIVSSKIDFMPGMLCF